MWLPCSRPISESSLSLSPDVVIPTAPATELEAGGERRDEDLSPVAPVKVVSHAITI